MIENNKNYNYKNNKNYNNINNNLIIYSILKIIMMMIIWLTKLSIQNNYVNMKYKKQKKKCRNFQKVKNIKKNKLQKIK